MAGNQNEQSPERQWRYNRYNKYNQSKLIAQSYSKPSAITNLSSSYVSCGSGSQQNHYAARFRQQPECSVMQSYHLSDLNSNTLAQEDSMQTTSRPMTQSNPAGNRQKPYLTDRTVDPAVKIRENVLFA
jgi:hypothetical protein